MAVAGVRECFLGEMELRPGGEEDLARKGEWEGGRGRRKGVHEDPRWERAWPLLRRDREQGQQDLSCQAEVRQEQ